MTPFGRKISASLSQLSLREMLTQQGEKLSLSADVSALFDMPHLRVHYEELLPGRRASKLHSHSHKEEMIVMLAGSGCLQVGDETLSLQAGQVFGMAASVVPHVLFNHSNETIRYLILTEAHEQDHVTYAESDTLF